MKARNSNTPKPEEILDKLRALPKGKFCALAGRQQKVINEQGRRYGWEVMGKTIDLTLVFPQILDTIARNRHRMLSEDDQDHENLAQQVMRHEAEKLRLQNEILATKADAAKEQIVQIHELQREFAWIEQQLRRFGEALPKEWTKHWNEFLSRLAAEFRRRGLLRPDEEPEE